MSEHATPHVVADDWPYGLRCGDCDRVLAEGETYHKRLEAMLDDTPISPIVCADCAIGVAA